MTDVNDQYQPPGQPVQPTPQPVPSARRGPGWGAVIALVTAGMVLSSGATLGAVVTYDQVVEPALSSASPSPDDSPTSPAASTAPASTSTAADAVDWTSVAEQVAPSSVAIAVATGTGASEGTGVILDADGTILTNNHVVAGAQKVQVTLHNGLAYAAQVVGTDPSTDLAVLRLDSPPDGLQPATVGDSSAVQVGQPVMALGTPLGLKNTVTTGIISAVDRPVTTEGEEADGSDSTYTSAIQTDAAINPGNSGGPLINAHGEVIGINTAIAGIPGASGQVGSIGLGFAIPSNTVGLIAEQLRDGGAAEHAFLGVTTSDGSRSIGEVVHAGAEVVGVEADSPASDAGLREGDLVTGFDDVTIGGAAALTGVVRGLAVGSEHEVHLVRDGSEQTLQVTLAARPD